MVIPVDDNPIPNWDKLPPDAWIMLRKREIWNIPEVKALVDALRAWRVIIAYDEEWDKYDPEFPWANFRAAYEHATVLTKDTLAAVEDGDG